MRSIIFLTEHQLGNHPETGAPISASASGRLRVIAPAKAISELNPKTHVRVHNPSAPIESILKGVDGDSVIVVSKFYKLESLEVLKKIRRISKALVVGDFCDNYFLGGEFFQCQQVIMSQIDTAFVNTYQMLGALRKSGFKAPAYVVKEGVDSKRAAPRGIQVSGIIRLLAFGNRLVCAHVEKWLCGISTYAETKRSVHLEIVTLIDKEVIRWHRKISRLFSDRFSVSLTQWNEVAMEHAFSRADVAIIPSEYSDFNATKSSNRLLDALNSGLPAICFPIEAYAPFTLGVRVGEDSYSLLESIEGGLGRLKEEVQSFQKQIDVRYNSSKIGAVWASSLNEAFASRGRQSELLPYREIVFVSNTAKDIDINMLPLESTVLKYEYIQEKYVLSTVFNSLRSIFKDHYLSSVYIVLAKRLSKVNISDRHLNQSAKQLGASNEWPNDLLYMNTLTESFAFLADFGYLDRYYRREILELALAINQGIWYLQVDGWYIDAISEVFITAIEIFRKSHESEVLVANEEAIAELILSQHLILQESRGLVHLLSTRIQ